MGVKLVTDVAQVAENVRRYQAGLPGMAEVMPYARAWYAMRAEPGWLLAPSKFVGYRNLSPELYLGRDKDRTPLDGRQTEAVLRPWSEPVEPGHPLHAELHGALNDLCARFGKRPNSLARLSLLHTDEGASATFSDDLVALLAAVFNGLSPAQKTAFRRLVA